MSTEESPPLAAENAAAPSGGALESDTRAAEGGEAAGSSRFHDFDQAVRQLPPYGRSLLRIRVPVTVTLAATKHPVGRIVELSPGSIIQFDKSCSEPLELEVGTQRVAIGEAVKVGEKFGLRITSMIMPEERFLSIRGRAPQKAAESPAG